MPSYHLTTGRSKLNQSVHKNSNYSKIKHMLDAISYKLFNNFLISTPIVTIMQVFISVPMILTLVPIPPHHCANLSNANVFSPECNDIYYK